MFLTSPEGQPRARRATRPGLRWGRGCGGGASEGRRGAGEGPSGRRCLSIEAFGWQVRRDDGPDSGQAQMVSGVAGASLTWCLSFLPF